MAEEDCMPRHTTLVLRALCVLVLASGCAFTDHRASLNPAIDVPAVAVGAGRLVRVTVVDERPHESIGRRGVGGGMGGTITLAEPLDGLVRAKLEEGLRRNGFAIAGASDEGAADLKVEIRDFEYQLVSGFWTGSAQTSAALKAICRDGDETYERLYRAEHKRGAFFVPSGGKTDRMLDETLSKVLDDVLSDDELMRFLARRHG